MPLSTAPSAQTSAPAACTSSLAAADLDLTLPDLNDRPVTLRAYRGKVLVINFWATWCVPCAIEIPGFKELYDRYRRRGIEIIGIDVDEPASRVAPYVRGLRINYPILLADDRQDVLDAFNVHVGLPTTLIVDRDGRICHVRVGFTGKERFEQLIRALL